MNNKELPRGRQTLGMARAERVRRGGITAAPLPPVREKELAPPPTQEEVKAANAGELAPRGIAKMMLDIAKKHPVATGGAAIAAVVGGFAAVEAAQGNIPGIHRSIDIPQYFDNNAAEGVIGDNNILRGISPETVQNAPQFDEEGNPLFLITVPKQGEVSHFKRELAEGGILPDILAQVKAKGVKNIFTQDNTPKNTDIPMPLDGHVFLIVTEENGKPILGGISATFMTPHNTLDFVNIDADGDIRIQALVDAPRISLENSNGRDYTKGLFVKRGKPIFRTLADGMTISYFREGGENGTLTTNRRIPGDINLLTISDPIIGKDKLPELQK